MKAFFDWFRESAIPSNDPWLILGKGPSFTKRRAYDLRRYHCLSLNHAVRELPVKVAHIIDLDVVDQCADAIEANAQMVVMPWQPHVRNQPGADTLEQLAQEHPVLRRLAGSGRLLWYNLSSASRPHPGSPVVQVRYFSAEAAVNLLAQAGVRTVRSLGVDGGSSYSASFDDLGSKTLLANGWDSFDRQFEGIARTLLDTGVDFAPLDVESPIRVFVAATEAEMLPVKVLEYSIKKHTSMSSEVVPLHVGASAIPTPRDPANRPRTPFSFQRFLIPELAGRRGRAIYLDSDMQVFRDLRRLWTLPMDGAHVISVHERDDTGRRPQFSVMLLDCAILDWDVGKIVSALDAGTLTYEHLMYDLAVAERVRPQIEPEWNSLERYVEGETCLLHYTDMQRQPWVSPHNPLAYLWFRDLFEALDSGFIHPDLIRRHVQRGFVRPSLAYQVDHRLDDPLLLPKRARALDHGYAAPYRAIGPHGATPWRSFPAMLRARLRRATEHNILYRMRRKVQARVGAYVRQLTDPR